MVKRALLVLGACGARPVVIAPPPPANHAQPAVGAALRSAGGHSVYFVAGQDGLLARAGEWSQVLAPGPIDAALYQPEQRLLWFLARGQLSVLDLDGNATPIAIATGVTIPSFAISTYDARVEATVLAPVDDATYPVAEVVIDRPSATSYVDDKPVHDHIVDEQEAQETALAQVKLVGADWLHAQASRASTVIAHATWEDGDDGTKVAPFEKDEELVFEPDCEDGWCSGTCSLSAPLADVPVDCATSLDASASQWFAGTQVCDADGCSDAGGTPLGWLDPSQIFDDPSYSKPIDDYT